MKRRVTRKTDTKSEITVDVSMKHADVYLLNTMTKLMQDENVDTQETNAQSDDAERVKIRTLLDDPSEVKRGRQKELNSLKERGRRDDVEAIISRRNQVIWTRWVDHIQKNSNEERAERRMQQYSQLEKQSLCKCVDAAV